MTNEEFYDAQIAPELKRLCELCMERGMGFVASVEYDPLNAGRGRTEIRPQNRRGSQLLTFPRL